MTVPPSKVVMRRGAVASASLLVVFLAAWQWGPGWLGIPTYIVPPLSMVADEALRAWQVNHLLLHTGVTAGEVLAGFLIGSLMGIVFGYLPAKRAEDCKYEYAQIKSGFEKTIMPNVDPDLLKKVQAMEWLK